MRSKNPEYCNSYEETNNILSRATGTDIKNNIFSDENEAKTVFEKLGFSIEVHKLDEVINDLASPSSLDIAPDEIVSLF